MVTAFVASTKEKEIVPGYSVNKSGDVFSYSNWRSLGKRKLAQTINCYGYPTVKIYIKGKRRHVTVHSLVAIAFLKKKPSPKHEIRHLNGIKTDNRINNLRWGTRKQNASDRARHGNTVMGERSHHAKLSASQVIKIKAQIKKGGVTLSKIAEKHGVKLSTISSIKYGKNWKHLK